MIQSIFRWVRVFAMSGLYLTCSVFGQKASAQDTNKRKLTIHVKGVFDTKITVAPFAGLNGITPIKEIDCIKDGTSETIDIAEKYLPGEFVLSFIYRIKEGANPYKSQRNIFINKQDIELFINPLYATNNDSVRYNEAELENTVYNAFIKENAAKRIQIDLLRQFMLSYESTKSKLFKQGIKEFEKGRIQYNDWLRGQTKKHHNLFVSSLFQFNYIPAISWGGEKNERLYQLLVHYFDGINFDDTLITRTSTLTKFMNDYMGLAGIMGTTNVLRDSLFIEAGSIACEKASKGQPKVYGWMVDYFYKGFEALGITKGMTMLEKHISNPNCLTTKKQQIVKHLEGMKKLIVGAHAPDFNLIDNDSLNFNFHKFKGKTTYKLLVFWSADCDHCILFVNELKNWYSENSNSEKFDIIAVSVDETETEIKKWQASILNFKGWKHLLARNGINNPVVIDYSIYSTPAMFLIGSDDNLIKTVPTSLEQLISYFKTAIK